MRHAEGSDSFEVTAEAGGAPWWAKRPNRQTLIMLISPGDHFSQYERVVTTSSELAEWIEEVQRLAAEIDCEAFWRGQSDAEWALSSSLSRISDSPTSVTDADLNKAEGELLDEAKRWVTAPPEMPDTDLEWLALLQHHGIPTRMVDFSRDPLVGVFFAVESLDEVEGRLFAVLIPSGRSRLDTNSTLRIGDIPSGEVRLWTPRREVSPRLAAQQGVFVLGRLPSTKTIRYANDDGNVRRMVRSEVVSTMTIPVVMVDLDSTPRTGSEMIRCVSVRIHVDKASVREALEGRARRGKLRPPPGTKINHAYCYPDVDGLRSFSRVWKRLARGIN